MGPPGRAIREAGHSPESLSGPVTRLEADSAVHLLRVPRLPWPGEAEEALWDRRAGRFIRLATGQRA